MEPLWTDKLESIATAIAALAAIIAGIYAILAYKKQNKDIQDQLNSLKKLAEHQAKENEIIQEQLTIDKRRRRTDIKPVLNIKSGLTMENGFGCGLINEGKTAYQICFDRLDSDGKSIEQTKLINELKNGEETFFTIKANKELEHYGISYQDEDKNYYKFYVKFQNRAVSITSTEFVE